MTGLGKSPPISTQEKQWLCNKMANVAAVARSEGERKAAQSRARASTAGAVRSTSGERVGVGAGPVCVPINHLR